MHGPIRLVRSDFPILAFLNQDEAYNASRQAVERLVGLGADVVAIGEGFVPEKTIRTAYTGNSLLDPIVGLGAYYRCIEQVAQARGLNPDTPVNLSKVTETL